MPAFNLKPTLRAYMRSAHAWGILEQGRIPAEFLNVNIQWAFPRGLHHGRGNFDFHPLTSFHRHASLGVLEIRKLGDRLPEWLDARGLTEEVVELLAQGWHVRTIVNYHHIPGTQHWGQTHWRHDYLIYDQDRPTRELVGALFLKDGSFGPARVGFDGLAEAVNSPHGRGVGCPRSYRRNSLVAVRPSPALDPAARLDLPDIRAQLRCYLDSDGLSGAGIASRFVNRFCRKGARSPHEPAYGLEVYGEFRRYFAQACAEARPATDLRATRVLWEHKVLMRVRLQRLMDEGVALDPHLLEAWSEIEVLAREIHLKATAASRCRDVRRLAGITQPLDRLAQLEPGLLTRVLQAL